MKYDANNIFARIISGEIASDKIYEDETVIAINDINPVAPVHVLVIPKKHYVDFSEFIGNNSEEGILNYYKAIKKITDQLGLDSYRLVTNKGSASGQSVFHFHTHIIAGSKNHNLIDKGL